MKKAIQAIVALILMIGCAAEDERFGETELVETGTAEQGLAVTNIAPFMGVRSCKATATTPVTGGCRYDDANALTTSAGLLPDKGPLKVKITYGPTSGLWVTDRDDDAVSTAIITLQDAGIPVQLVTSEEDVLVVLSSTAPSPPCGIAPYPACPLSGDPLGVTDACQSGASTTITPAPFGPRKTCAKTGVTIYTRKIQDGLMRNDMFTAGCYNYDVYSIYQFLVAKVIVHELGHALGLGHGGGDAYAMAITTPLFQTNYQVGAPFPQCISFFRQDLVASRTRLSPADAAAVSQYLSNTNLPE